MRFDPVPAPAVQNRGRRAPGERLAEALLILSGGRGRITRQSEANWASITFAGTRHSFDVVFEGEAAIELGEDFIAELPEHDFAIPGRLVADAEVTKVDHRSAPPLMKLTCELLLIDEG
jgi:hypothetical protein